MSRGDIARAAKRYWNGLSELERWQIGDELVLGDFDWRTWFSDKPSGAFLDALDYERILWEQSRG